ncbi:unnamed protein product, partial [Prorocentrum cordatum]
VSCDGASLTAEAVEDIVRRVRAVSCVCELTCSTSDHDLHLVLLTTGAICAGRPLLVRELSSNLTLGRPVAIRYPGEDLWHERILIGPGHRDAAGEVTNWWIVTPDGDFYEEDISMEAQQAVARMRSAGQEIPDLPYFVNADGAMEPLGGVGRRRRRGGPAEGEAVAAAGLALVGGTAIPDTPLPVDLEAAEGAGGAAAPGAAAPYLAVLPERPAPRDGLVWLVTESADGHETVGMEVTPRAGDVIITSTSGLALRHVSFLQVQVQVQVVLGHATCCGLVGRETLTVFATVCPFIRRHYDRPAPFWPSVADELRAFAGLMVLLVSSWESDWNPLVVATDASETGYGICSRWFDPATVAAVGRCRERDRYLAEGHVGTRAAALGADMACGEPLLVDGCLGRSDLQPDPRCAEVPSYMAESAGLGVVGGWNFNA